MTARPLFTTADQASRVQGAGHVVATLLDTAESGGRQVLREFVCEPGQTIDLTSALAANHYVYVLEGRWDMTLDGVARSCAPDTTLFAPRGVSCTGAPTEGRGRLLLLHFPD